MRRTSGNLLLYALTLAVSIGVFFLIRFFGNSLVASGAPEPSKPAVTAFSETSGTLMHLLLALVLIIIVARILGAFFRRLNQPRVVGEIVAGILLGPSFLRLAGTFRRFPSPSRVNFALPRVDLSGWRRALYVPRRS